MSRKTTSYTPEARQALMAGIAARVEHGVSLPDAATAQGARPETVRTWLRRGRREDSGPYADFAQAVEQARERATSRPEPMGDDELARRVSEMVRGGSVQAAKLRWEMLRASEGRHVKPAGGILDELEERRARRR